MAGIKGRFEETKIADDHVLKDATYRVPVVANGAAGTAEAPALTALNERLRDDYSIDCARGVERWNRIVAKYGIDFQFKLPHRAFHRAIGIFSGVKTTPDGKLIDEAEWTRRSGEWLPSDADRAFVQSLMAGAVVEPGKMANWIAPPVRGIDGKPLDFEYVRFA
jgi:benzoyl-CoA 2,3-dioxygenase component B